jgi:RNA recognition motif-containing protein
VQTKEHQPTKKTTAPKPQYQPFQQQLLGSTAMSDPYDAYLVSSKLNNLQTASPPAKAAKASSTGSSNSRHDKDGRGKNTSKDSHPSHPYHASNSVIDKLPAESRMFIKKLPHSITHDEIVDHFSKYGKILEVVPKSGFGFVQFESVDACQKAVENENGKAFKTVELGKSTNPRYLGWV